MKIRKGFVSNSSSSSFIVISHNEKTLQKVDYSNLETLVIDLDFENYEYGWDFEHYDYYGDKIIFAYLQAKYVESNHPEWLIMLDNVIKEFTGVKNIEWKISLDDAYIDHQSTSYEGENIEMFESEDDLKAFLFNTNSFIKT